MGEGRDNRDGKKRKKQWEERDKSGRERKIGREIGGDKGERETDERESRRE